MPSAETESGTDAPAAALDSLANCRTPYVIGVRHHSPALAAAIPALLADAAPEVLFVELPADFAPWLPYLADPATRPPVALAGHGPHGLVFLPFAEFSPELVALRWAREAGVPVVAFDLPVGAASERGRGDGELERSPSVTPSRSPSASQSPLPARQLSLERALRDRAGGRAEDDLWDRLVEAAAPGGEAEALRRAALLVGWALRRDTAVARRLDPHDLRREAYMRRLLAERLGVRAAAVVGAFHGPALLPGVAGAAGMADDAPRAGAGAVAEVTTSLVPYAYPLLDERSGYPAGIRDPEWQQGVVRAAGDPARLDDLLVTTVVRICAAVRAAGHPCGPPDAREVIRHARDLASLRGLPAAGRGELIEAVQTALTQGQLLGRGRVVAQALETVLVGTRHGRLAPGTPRSGLAPAVESLLTALGLPDPTTPGRRDLRLDPHRSPLDRQRELTLRQLAVCRVPYGTPAAPNSTGGDTSIGTRWTVEWTPATAAMLEAVAVHGTELPLATEGLLRQRARAERREGGPTAAQILTGFEDAAHCGLPSPAADRLTESTHLLPTTATLPELLAALALLDRLAAGVIPGLPATWQSPAVAAASAELSAAGIRALDGLMGSESPADARALAELATRATGVGARAARGADEHPGAPGQAGVGTAHARGAGEAGGAASAAGPAGGAASAGQGEANVSGGAPSTVGTDPGRPNAAGQAGVAATSAQGAAGSEVAGSATQFLAEPTAQVAAADGTGRSASATDLAAKDAGPGTVTAVAGKHAADRPGDAGHSVVGNTEPGAPTPTHTSLRLSDALARLSGEGTAMIRGAAGVVRVLVGEVGAGAFGEVLAGRADGAGTAELRVELGAFLVGALSAGGALVEAGALLEPLIERVESFADRAFLTRLPALRQGFDALSPAARGRLLETVRTSASPAGFPDRPLDPRHVAADLAGREVLAARGLLSALGSPVDTAHPEPSAAQPITPAAGRTLSPDVRWQLLLGRTGELGANSPRAGRIAAALDELYGTGRGEGAAEAVAQRGGDQAPYPDVRGWAEELEALFGEGVREEVLAAAAASGRLDAALEMNPDAARPSVELLRTVLSYAGGLPEGQLTRLRPLVARLVRELTESLANRLRPALAGLAHPRPTRRPGGPLDLARTVRANLATARRDPADGTVTVLPEHPVFKTRARKTAEWRIVLVVDVSGSMEASTIWSAVTAAVLAGVPALSTHFVAFSTEVLDLTDHVADPLSLLLEVRVGGGTHIAKGLRHARSLVTVPSRTLVVLVSDFEEGGPVGPLLAEVRALVDAGCHVLGCASLDDAGRPRYSVGVAGQLVGAGMPVAALSPLELARWVGEKVGGTAR